MRRVPSEKRYCRAFLYYFNSGREEERKKEEEEAPIDPTQPCGFSP
jgi:hypothetical protein